MAVTDLEARKLAGLLSDNPTMGDGNALFSAPHGNLATYAAFSVSAVDVVRKLMRAQTGVNREWPLNIGPRFLIVPAAFETNAEQLLAPLFAATVEEVNPFAGAMSLIVESRLDELSGLAWYIAADPARMSSLAYVVREGAETPQVETEYDFATKGMAFSVVYDFGVCAQDWRGIAKMPASG